MVLEKLKRGRAILLQVPQDAYYENVLDIVSRLSGQFGSFCYVTVNKSALSLRNDFKERELDLKRFTFIDSISGDISSADKNTVYVSSPSNLFRISLAITNALQDKKVEILLFDSLSTLLAYNSSNLVVQFAQAMINKVRSEDVAGLFLMPKMEESSLLKDLSMFVDAVESL
ncbi:hypothetical protein HY501_02845 [Candidatus Woesearchaeota archaeon]|nr:hypothetical protein [Candidatus Woesearchaeota archaeon]